MSSFHAGSTSSMARSNVFEKGSKRWGGYMQRFDAQVKDQLSL